MSLTEGDMLPPVEEGGPAVEAEPTFAEEVIPPDMAAALSTTTEELEKFVKLPARPLKTRVLHGQTQVCAFLPSRQKAKILNQAGFGKADASLEFTQALFLQALSSIELARQSRIAANRAYLAGLHLSPQAMTGGLVEAVGADSSLVLRAARMLADKAAITEARSQVRAVANCKCQSRCPQALIVRLRLAL